MASAQRAIPVVVDQISRSILILRGQRVILDRELAAIYGSTTKRLNEQVKRNRDRFPEDFMFQLTAEESERGQNIKYRPYASTEHGAIQAANVLNSSRATVRRCLIAPGHTRPPAYRSGSPRPRKSGA